MWMKRSKSLIKIKNLFNKMRFLMVTVLIFICFLQLVKANLITLASLASQGDCEFYKVEW